MATCLILEFTLLFSAARSVQVLPAVLVVITDALYITVNARFKEIERRSHCSLHRCQLV